MSKLQNPKSETTKITQKRIRKSAKQQRIGAY